MPEIPTPNQQQVKAAIDAVKAENKKQAVQQAVVTAAQDAQEAINKIADEAKKPVVNALKKLKKITADLNNAVDMNMTWDMAKAGMAAGGKAFSEMAGGKIDAMMDAYYEAATAAEDSSIVQDTATQILNATIKQGFETIKPPIQTLESIVPVCPLTEPITAICDALQGLVEIGTTDVPDDVLNKMLTAKVNTDQLLKDAQNKLASAKDEISDTAKDKYAKVKNGIKDKVSEAEDKSKEVIDNIAQSTKDIAAGLGEGIQQSWKNFKCPEMPPGIETTLKDFIDAVMHVCSNIQSVAITVLFKLVGAIFDCLNQIVGVIGVPTFPDPLDKIMKLIPDAIAIFSFIANLPISLVKLGKAIVKKKVKEIAILSDPPAAIAPMKTVPEVTEEGPKSCGGGGGSEGNNKKKKYTVKFYSGEDIEKVISQQEVEEGNAASDPGPQSKSTTSNDYYWKFVGWNQDFSSVNSSMDIYPNFVNVEIKKETTTNVVNGISLSPEQANIY